MSQIITTILEHNKEFVSSKEYENFTTDRLPDRKLAIITCMDTRLTALLPAALGIKNGDIKLIKTAGGVISHPFGSVMRSLLLCVYDLGVEEIAVIGHHDCGMCGLGHENMAKQMLARGIPERRLQRLKYYGVDLEKWLLGFTDVKESVLESMRFIQNHPLIPGDIIVHGLLMHPSTGKLDLLGTCRAGEALFTSPEHCPGLTP